MALKSFMFFRNTVERTTFSNPASRCVQNFGQVAKHVGFRARMPGDHLLRRRVDEQLARRQKQIR